MSLVGTLALTALLAAGCSDDEDVTGLWQSRPGAKDVVLPPLSGGFEGRLRLAVGQYGKDVSGTLQFYTDSFHKTSLFTPCPCVYVDDGETRDGRFTFAFGACNDVRIVGSFELTSDGDVELLDGVFTESGKPGKEYPAVLERIGGMAEIEEEELDRGCQ